MFNLGNNPTLQNGEIHLWTLYTKASAAQVEELFAILSKAEKERASFFKFEHLQQNYIVTRSALRLLLAHYTNIDPDEINLRIHRKGKPYLLNDFSLYFNISHSFGACVYAFSRDDEVGIDIEQVRELSDLDQMIEKNMTPREKKYFQKDPDNKLSRFMQFWTFKEAYLKAIGEGMRLTPENLEFSLENGNIRLESVNSGFDTGDWQFKSFTCKGNYTGTLAYQGKESLIKEMNLTLTG